MHLIDTSKTWVKVIIIITMYSFIFEILYPLNYAFSHSGPSQAESSGFSLNTTNNMVDKFTGDFNYSIPLMDVEGYPITISYNQNVGMNTEATWVGLGWNLNVGSVTRDMRGIPDDFNGTDIINREVSRKDVIIEGKKNGASTTAQYGPFALTLYAMGGRYTNSINGAGKTYDFGLGAAVSASDNFNFGLSGNIGFSADTQNGVGRSTGFGVDGLNVSSNFHSREGRTSLDMSVTKAYSTSGGVMSASASAKVGYTRSLGSMTAIPKISIPTIADSDMRQKNINAFISLYGVYMAASYNNSKYENSNKLLVPTSSTIPSRGYGYFHYAKAGDHQSSMYTLMDYNQSQTLEYSEELKTLPFSTPTYDVFHLNAAGVSGSFRGQRSDVGTLKDATILSLSSQTTKETDISVGYEPPVAVGAGGGFTYGDGDQTQQTGHWYMSGQTNFNYKGGTNANFDNTVFFKSGSELTPRNMDLLNAYGGSKPFHRSPILNSSDKSISFNSLDLSDNKGASHTILGAPQSYNAREEIRATHYEPKTVGQELNLGNTTIEFFPENEYLPGYGNTTLELRGTNTKALHHLSTVTVTTTDGLNYRYGTPVYNLKQEDVVFSVAGLKGSLYGTHGQVEYTHGVDNSVNNKRGKSGFYERTTTPGYAHSFLLTEMTSSDYVDRTGNGLSLDDIGNYYRFNYSKVHDENNPFTWRFPISGKAGASPKANFNDGLRSTPFDDMANYVYGEKELVYVNSVESKNMVAHFHISKREDGYAIKENGTLDLSKSTRKLDSISLYNKNDLIHNPNAKPIQVVIFEFDYSLCKKYDNNPLTYTNPNSNQSGKLTLKSIRIKTGDSDEQALYPYQFEYNGNNDDYSTINIDRWGNYKQNINSHPNTEYPYVNQETTSANTSAKNWKLTDIINPSGGRTTISYEADRYGHVQNKSAMRHYQNVGMTNMVKLLELNNSPFSSGNLYQLSNGLRASAQEIQSTLTSLLNAYNFLPGLMGVLGAGDIEKVARRVPNNVLVFKLGKTLSNGTKDDLEKELLETYFRDESSPQIKYYDEVYLKTRIKISPNSMEKEDVPTFARIGSPYIPFINTIASMQGYNHIKSIGLVGNANQGAYDYGYIVLTTDNVQDMKLGNYDDNKGEIDLYNVSPIQKTAWQFARRNLPDLVYSDCDYNESTQVFDCDYKLNLDWKVAFGAKINKLLNRKDFCRYFDNQHSYVRLNHNNDREEKLASTARVSSITYSDGWDEMSGEYESVYKWNYKYVNDKGISSGVADYEPMLGKDENPFFQWARYWNKLSSFPDEAYYTEEPIAELLYPAPVIGYEKVTVSFADNHSANKVGKSVSTSHSSKSYPTVVKRTNIEKISDKSTKWIALETVELVGLSQGYTVETNNFHGQPKLHKIIDALGNEQSSTQYKYKNSFDKFKTLDREGASRSEVLGLEYDIYTTSSFSASESEHFSVGGNVSVMWIFPFIFYPNIRVTGALNKSTRGFYTNTFNKTIHTSAILESVETNYLGSENSAKNLYYDRYSGNVIVSSLKDEYDDELYSMNYPGHWYYENFQNTHRNTDYLGGITITNGVISPITTQIDELLSEGTQILCSNGNTNIKATVLEKTNNEIKIIRTGSGQILNTGSQSYNVSLIKPGTKNRLNTVMQSVTTKDGSFLANGFTFPSKNIISVDAVSFKENNNVYCGEPGNKEDYLVIPFSPGKIIDPYYAGVKGVYRIANSFALQDERLIQDPHKTRYDAVLNNYKSFYKLVNGEWYKVNDPNHPDYLNLNDYRNYRMLDDITMHDEFGKPIEMKNQIGVYGGALHGYGKSLKNTAVAQASNAKQSQIAFDGFEDYSYIVNSYEERHFDFFNSINDGSASLVTNERHSGLRSLKLEKGKEAVIVKDISSIELCNEEESNITNGVYKVKECDCIEDFSPEPGKYVVSLWVKEEEAKNAITYENVFCEIGIVASSGSIIETFLPSGPIIDGWQRIEGIFEIPLDAETISVKLKNKDAVSYFDDIRLHPFNSSMVTIVYSPFTMLPTAKHDAYNYTTFYNYDENLSLVKIRVETIEGIKTVSEKESGGKKVYQSN